MVIMNSWKDLVTGGVGLSLGASVIGRLPASAASAGVSSGLATAGTFFPVMGTLGASSIVVNQLKELRRARK